METTVTLQEAEELRQIISNPIVGQDSRVSVSVADTTMGFLQAKLTAGSNVSLTVENPGGDESLRVDAVQQVPTPTGVDGRVLTESGSVAGWADAPLGLPTPTGVDGRVLVERGSTPGWEDLATGGATTEGPIAFPIDFTNGITITPGAVVFASQADVTAFLAAHSATSFKYVMDCWDALASVIAHPVTFQILPGVHRPRVGEAGSACYTFEGHYLGSSLVGASPKAILADIKLIGVKADLTTQVPFADWEQMAAESTRVSGNGSPSTPLVISGASYTPNALRGYYVTTTYSPYAYVIVSNTATEIVTAGSMNVSGTVAVRIVSPVSILRNSLDDIVAAETGRFLYHGPLPNRNAKLWMENLRIDRWAVSGIQSPQMELTQVLDDGARLRDQFGVASSSGRMVDILYKACGSTWLGRCSYRGCGLSTSPAAGGQMLSTGSTYYEQMTTLWVLQCYGGGMTSQVMTIANVDFVGADFWIDNPTSTEFAISMSNARVSVSSSGMYFVNCLYGIVFGWRVQGGATIRVLGQRSGGIGVYVGQEARLYDMTVARYTTGYFSTYTNLGTGVSMQGPDAMFQCSSHLGTDGGFPTPIQMAGISYTDFTPFADARYASTQPGSTLAGIVTVSDVAPATSEANGTLAFTLSGSTLTYTAPSDTAGTPVAVVAGGEYVLYSANGKWIRVKVRALPAANVSQTFTVARGTIVDGKRNIYWRS